MIKQQWHSHIPDEFFKQRAASSRNNIVFGIGINDSDYATRYEERVYKSDGTTERVELWRCKIYKTWCNMLNRAYNTKLHVERPTYEGVSVCKEWHTFSIFAKWMCKQDWQGKQLDKDILVEGNKIYSPETCVFVSAKVNIFLTDSGKIRGNYPIGVSLHKGCGKFSARVNNGEKGKYINLGYFDNAADAHFAWKREKYRLATQLADQEDNKMVAEALIERYKLD